MCTWVVRQCRYCSHTRSGWWETCGAFWKQYERAIDPRVKNPSKRPPKPTEAGCPDRGREVEPLLSLGACVNNTCPGKVYYMKKVAEKKQSNEAKALTEKQEIEAFMEGAFKRIPVQRYGEPHVAAPKVETAKPKGNQDVLNPRKKTTVTEHDEAQEALRSMMHNGSFEEGSALGSIEYDIEQSPLPIAALNARRRQPTLSRKKTTVAEHDEAQEALLSMMQNGNFDEGPAVGSVESDVPEPPRPKRHARGGQMMVRKTSQKHIVFKRAVTKKGTGIAIAPPAPVLATDTLATSKPAELSTPNDKGKDRKSFSTGGNIDFAALLDIINRSCLQSRSSSSEEASPKKSDGEKANVESFDTNESTPPSENIASKNTNGPKSTNRVDGRTHETAGGLSSPKRVVSEAKTIVEPSFRAEVQHIEVEAGMTPLGFENLDYKPRGRVIRPPPGFGPQRARLQLPGTPLEFKEYLAQVIRPPPGFESKGARPRGDGTPPGIKEHLAQVRKKSRTKLPEIQATTSLSGLNFFKPRLLQTRPRLDRLDVQDQLRGFFGRTAKLERRGQLGCLYADFKLVFRHWATHGLKKGHYEIELVPRGGLGFSLPAYNEVLVGPPVPAAPKRQLHYGEFPTTLQMQRPRGPMKEVRTIAAPYRLGFAESGAMVSSSTFDYGALLRGIDFVVPGMRAHTAGISPEIEPSPTGTPDSVEVIAPPVDLVCESLRVAPIDIAPGRVGAIPLPTLFSTKGLRALAKRVVGV